MSGRKETAPGAAGKSGDSDPYLYFAEIYDQLMCGVDYESWADYVEQLLRRFGKQARSLVDLACGTGSSALPFAARGYRVGAMDSSEAMLQRARFKVQQAELPVILYLNDLRSFCPVERYDLALLFQDGLNYLLTEAELAAALGRVYDLLTPGGTFIFDLTRPSLRGGEEKSSVSWADDVDFTLIWESFYKHKEAIWEVALTGFYREKEGVLYRKFQERHREKDFEPERVRSLLEEAGFTVLGLYPSFSLEPACGSEAKLTFAVEK